ncbi:UNVERIFIED_CONTAM: hypothetical protein HDU68_010683, partial [Siphonaria sp. JEL0065]
MKLAGLLTISAAVVAAQADSNDIPLQATDSPCSNVQCLKPQSSVPSFITIPTIKTSNNARSRVAAEQPSPFQQISFDASIAASSSQPLASDLPLVEYAVGVTEYRAVIQVGTPQRDYNVLFDTGSFSMWLYGATCPSQACKGATHRYDVKSSSTGENLGLPAVEQTYADGSGYNGSIVSDTILVSGYSVSKFRFVQVTSYISSSPTGISVADNYQDGIVGMGFHPRNGGYSNTLIEELIANGHLPYPQFSWYVTVDETQGYATFGGYDMSLFANMSQMPSWVPMITNDDLILAGKLALPLVSASVNGVPVETFTAHESPLGNGLQGKTGAASWDTGTAASIVSDVLVKAIGSQIPGAKLVQFSGSTDISYSVPCAVRKEVGGGPTVTLNFAGGGSVSITAMEYVEVDQNNDGNCYIALTGRVGGYRKGTYLIGNTFLKRYVNVFDFEKKWIGFSLALGRSSGAADNSTKKLKMLSPRPNAPEPENDGELSYEVVDQISSGKQSPDVAEHLELLDTVLADHLLETIQAGLANAENARGLLIEASLGFSPLFITETPPALALFSYSSDAFKEDSGSIKQPDLNVVEVHTFEPFDRVYQNAVDSIRKEGLFQTQKDLVFVIGGPGSGKGTQCARIAKEFKLTHLSTGDLLRAEVASGSELGLFANSLMKDGKIVPKNIIIELLKNAIERDASSDSKGILIDGFPRAVDQAIEFERSVSSASFILNFYCPLPILEARLLERGKTSGRADDNLETIRKRFKTFEEESLPVLEYFGDRVFIVDGGRDVDVIYDEVRGLIKQEHLFEEKKVVIFAVSDGTCPEECHELCLRLSNQHNLALTSFGNEHNFYGASEAVEQISEDAGEVEEVTVEVVPQHQYQQSDQLAVPLAPLRSGSSHSLHDAMSELDGELAEHLLETVRFHVDVNRQAENPTAGLLIEASFGFSPLFDDDSIPDSEKPALALFSYPSEAFQDSHYSLPSFDDALNVLEIVKFQPFEKVYKSVKESVLREGLLEN